MCVFVRAWEAVRVLWFVFFCFSSWIRVHTCNCISPCFLFFILQYKCLKLRRLINPVRFISCPVNTPNQTEADRKKNNWRNFLRTYCMLIKRTDVTQNTVKMLSNRRFYLVLHKKQAACSFKVQLWLRVLVRITCYVWVKIHNATDRQWVDVCVCVCVCLISTHE